MVWSYRCVEPGALFRIPNAVGLTASVSCIDGYGNRAPDALLTIPKAATSPTPTVTSTPFSGTWKVTRRRLVRSIRVRVLRDGVRIGQVRFPIDKLHHGRLVGKSLGREPLVSVQPIRTKSGALKFCIATPRGRVCAKPITELNEQR